MRAYETMYDDDGKQVALFPLVSFIISQSDTGTYSHGGGQVYWATDYLGYNDRGTRQLRAPCYAPVDIKLIWKSQAECCAVWESLEEVHLANGMIDYLTILVYHDNDIENNTYYSIGTIKRQGEVFNKSGTGGRVTGDHVHLETGYGRYATSSSGSYGTAEYKYHITDWTRPKRLHNYNALFINDTTPRHSSYYPTEYPWVTYEGGHPAPPSEPIKYKFKWVLYANKLRNKQYK